MRALWLRDVDGSRDVEGEAVVGVLDPATDQVLSMAGIEGAVVVSVPTGPGSVLCGVG